jgi:dolichyl-phosphate-mannose-protein mannosyltransferase
LDADERRAAASKGLGSGRVKRISTGGLNITSGEWKLLFAVVILASLVRLFRLSKPDSVVCAALMQSHYSTISYF